VQLAASHLPEVDAASVSELLASMAGVLDGMIVIESDGRARYRPTERPDSFLRRWNDGLALLRLVEPELTEAHDVATLFAQADKFCTTLRDRRARLSDLSAQLRRLAAVLGVSPRALAVLNSFGDLLGADNHEAYLNQAAMLAGGAKNLPALADEVALLQRLAAQAPKLIEIKRYLEAIPGSSATLRQVQSMRLQLLAGLDFQTLFARPELADSLAERFEQFKAQYRELYSAAHRQRRAEVEQFVHRLELQQVRLPVLARLNRVRELGHPIGTELEHDLKMLTRKLMPCPESIELALAASPRCPACEFGFEDGPPLAEMDEFEQRLVAALNAKLKALSHPSVIRVLTEADSRQRLVGLLQLLRQDATDELAAALDEDTANYIVSLLIKARSEASTQIAGRAFTDLPAAELGKGLRKLS
jgi:hypothetical protein